MQNLATIYRFYTPFIDITSERELLRLMRLKILKNLKAQGIEYIEKQEQIWDYIMNNLTFTNIPWKMVFQYLSTSIKNYYSPVFKLDIFLDTSKIQNKNIVEFLTNIFECFDWLNEKEYLIDIDSSLSYKKWILKTIVTPSYDFRNIDDIEADFASKDGLTLLQNFIENFKTSDFILTNESSELYHKLHWILLYLFYLVYIIKTNLDDTSKILSENESFNDKFSQANYDFMKKRLSRVREVSVQTFEAYNQRLEGFMKLFCNK